MLRNLVITLIMVMSLSISTAHAYNDDAPRIAQITDHEWITMFQNTGYMAKWLGARVPGSVHAQRANVFANRLGNDIIHALRTGIIGEEQGARILKYMKRDMDIGMSSFGKSPYNTRERLEYLINFERYLYGPTGDAWSSIRTRALTLTHPMDQ